MLHAQFIQIDSQLQLQLKNTQLDLCLRFRLAKVKMQYNGFNLNDYIVPYYHLISHK